MQSDKIEKDIEIVDLTPCGLGESPLWHPLRSELFWVDLPNHKLYRKTEKSLSEFEFKEMVSAIGWIDEHNLLLAMETGLYKYEISSQSITLICEIEPEKPTNRSNDGRADPWGGFWISTMDKSAQEKAGAIYRWHCGKLTQIVTDLTIPNGICFDKKRALAYYADSSTRKVFKIQLSHENGQPVSESQLFLDLSHKNLEIDGAVTDQHGNYWTAVYDSACVQCYSPEGELLDQINVPTLRPTCPAFSGKDYKDMHLTSAAIGLEDEVAKGAKHGATFRINDVAIGHPEPPINIVNKD